jgi:MYXO-CTERM domain-containing protein
MRSDAVLVLPRGGFAAGARYTFRGPGDTEPLEVTVAAERLEGASANLVVADEVRGPIKLGQPFGQATAGVRRDLTLTLPDSVQRFEGALAYETIVDGKRWHPTADRCDYLAPDRSTRGRGRDRLTRPCADATASTQQVTMRAVLVGTDIALTANEAVVLRCQDPPARGCGGCALAPPPKPPPWWALASAVVLVALRRRPPAGTSTTTATSPSKSGSRGPTSSLVWLHGRDGC